MKYRIGSREIDFNSPLHHIRHMGTRYNLMGIHGSPPNDLLLFVAFNNNRIYMNHSGEIRIGPDWMNRQLNITASFELKFNIVGPTLSKRR